MATKAEQARAESAKKGPNPKRVKKAAQKKPAKAKGVGTEPNENRAAGRKATFAKETTAPGKRPSRKSTRSSANRAKPDTNLTLRSERAKRAPSDAAATAKARATRPRGKPATPKNG